MAVRFIGKFDMASTTLWHVHGRTGFDLPNGRTAAYSTRTSLVIRLGCISAR